MKVAVTGAAGLAGRHIVDELVEHGFDVVAVDVVQGDNTNVEWKLVDVTDYDAVHEALRGAQAIVHMGAIPRPGSVSSSKLFEINTLGTFNVFEAAAAHDIKRVVQGSSMSVLGYPFFYHRFAPDSIPIDESHATHPQDPYGLTKLIGEEIAEAFVRRTGMAVVSLRLAWIHTPESFAEQLVPLWDDPDAGAANLWGYVDGRDVAQACRLAIGAPVDGHLACFISAEDTFMREETRELISDFYPESSVSADLEKNSSLFSIKLARTALGYSPEYSWKSYGL